MTMLGPILPEDLRFKRLPHLPYLPVLAPIDYHILGPFEEAMGGKTFRSDEEVQ
jgi:hypothetical protein